MTNNKTTKRNNICINIGVGENSNIELAINEFNSNNSSNNNTKDTNNNENQSKNNKKNNINLKKVNSNEEFLEEIKNKSSDAYVRGSLSASSTITYLKDIYSKNSKNKIARASLIKNNNADKNNTHNNNYDGDINNNTTHNNTDNYIDNTFLLSPVGIDEGTTVESKLEISINACEFLINYGKTPKIAILSGGREEDKGRGKLIDEMLDDSKELYINIKNYLETSKSINKGTVKNYNILIEEAINDNCNLIIAPNGIIGNLIFRSLILVSGWESYGAITLGINEIFIDTSRSQTKEGYLRAIELAYNLAKRNK